MEGQSAINQINNQLIRNGGPEMPVRFLPARGLYVTGRALNNLDRRVGRMFGHILPNIALGVAVSALTGGSPAPTFTAIGAAALAAYRLGYEHVEREMNPRDRDLVKFGGDEMPVRLLMARGYYGLGKALNDLDQRVDKPFGHVVPIAAIGLIASAVTGSPASLWTSVAIALGIALPRLQYDYIEYGQ